jgi:hypothetical protein
MEWMELGEAQLLATALAGLSGLLLLALVYRTRRPPHTLLRSPSTEAAELQAALDRLRQELPQVVQEAQSRLDIKIHTLRELLEEADQVLRELRALRSETAPRVRVPEPGLAVQHRKTAPEPNRPAVAGGIDRRAAEAGPGSDASELRAQRYAHVYALADAGFDPPQISSETGMHRGEVELVLSLRRKRMRGSSNRQSEPVRAVHCAEEATL